MTEKTATDNGKKRLKLRKETLRDLDVQERDKQIKGGMARQKQVTKSCKTCATE